MKKLFTILLFLIAFAGFSQAPKKPVEFNYPVLFKGGNFEILNQYKYDPAQSYTDVGEDYTDSDSVYTKGWFKVDAQLPVLTTTRKNKYIYTENGTLLNHTENWTKFEFKINPNNSSIRLSKFDQYSDLINSEYSSDTTYVDFSLDGINRTNISSGNSYNWSWPSSSGQLLTAADISVPTTTSQLTNNGSGTGSPYATESQLPVSQLQILNEGNGNGYRIFGRNPDNYGNVGLNAIDFSISTGSSSTRGATGQNSFALSRDATASGFNSFALGDGSVASSSGAVAIGSGAAASGTGSISLGSSSVASGSASISIGGSINSATASRAAAVGGTNNIASGEYSIILGGRESEAYSMGEAVLGIWGTAYTPNSTTGWNANDRLLNVGNGTSYASKSNAFTILKNGLATLPSVTTALINAEPTGKAVVIKEHLTGTVLTSSSTVTLTADKMINYFANTSATDVVWTLPDATLHLGKQIIVVNKDSGVITLNSFGATAQIFESGGSLTTIPISTSAAGYGLYSDGVHWVALY